MWLERCQLWWASYAVRIWLWIPSVRSEYGHTFEVVYGFWFDDDWLRCGDRLPVCVKINCEATTVLWFRRDKSPSHEMPSEFVSTLPWYSNNFNVLVRTGMLKPPDLGEVEKSAVCNYFTKRSWIFCLWKWSWAYSLKLVTMAENFKQHTKLPNWNWEDVNVTVLTWTTTIIARSRYYV